MKKRTLLILAALLLFIFALPISAKESEIPTYNAGQNNKLTWDYTDGTLTIYGIDKMTEFCLDCDPESDGLEVLTSAPWTNLRDKVTTLVITEGVQSVGWYAFNKFTALTTVWIPKTVTQIDECAFAGCENIKVVNYGSDNGPNDINIDPGNECLTNAKNENWGAINGYRVCYNANGGTNNPENPLYYPIGDAKIALKNPTKAHATFLGWYQDKALTKKVSYLGGGMTGDITLYAKWIGDPYKVKFYKNASSATGSMPVQTLHYGSTTALKANKFKNGSKVFGGWNTKANGTGKIYLNKAKVKNLTKTKNATIKLYAIWVKKPLKIYTIKFNPNGGSCSFKSKKVIRNAKFGVLPTASKKCCTFEGWYTAKKGGTKITASKIAAISSGRTYYAHWKTRNFAGYIKKKGSISKTLSGGGSVSISYKKSSGNVTFKYTDSTGNVLKYTQSASNLKKTSCVFYAKGQIICTMANSGAIIGRGNFDLKSNGSVTKSTVTADSNLSWSINSGGLTYPYYMGFQLLTAQSYYNYATTMTKKGLEGWRDMLKARGYKLEDIGFTNYK